MLAWQIRNKHVLVVGGGEVSINPFCHSSTTLPRTPNPQNALHLHQLTIAFPSRNRSQQAASSTS